MINKTFEDICKDKPGTIYADWEIDGYRCLVSRGNVSVCAYVGVKPDHCISGMDYRKLSIRCHGGLTFSMQGNDNFWPAGYWWIGWDYGHLGDKSTYDMYFPGAFPDGHGWTPDEVMGEIHDVVEQLKKIQLCQPLNTTEN